MLPVVGYTKLSILHIYMLALSLILGYSMRSGNDYGHMWGGLQQRRGNMMLQNVKRK